MQSINRLSSIDELATGDLLAFFDISNSDSRKGSLSLLLAWMQANLTFPDASSYTTQYAAPSATGFSVTITDGANDNTNVHLILTPTAGYAAGTIVLPPKAGLVDKQEVLVNCTQAVTTLTIDGNGATSVTGAPTSLSADDFFRLKYDVLGDAWYRVG